jgi:F0F1-type ATP synthase assembly protein I
MMEEQQSRKDPNKTTDKGLRNFARYSGIAFQMAGIIFLSAFGGKKLDEITGWKTPVFTIILSLLGVFAAIWFTIKDLLKK